MKRSKKKIFIIAAIILVSLVAALLCILPNVLETVFGKFPTTMFSLVIFALYGIIFAAVMRYRADDERVFYLSKDQYEKFQTQMKGTATEETSAEVSAAEGDEDVFMAEEAAEEASAAAVPQESAADTEASMQFDSKYDCSFYAKLVLGSDLAKEAYCRLVTLASGYRVKIAMSRRKVRIYYRRTPLARISFRGRKLCISFNLDPAKYEGMYRLENVSENASYSVTPMMMRITAERRIGWAEQLLVEVFEANGIEKGKGERKVVIPAMTQEELIAAGEIREHN